MNKLQKLKEGIKDIIKQPALLNIILNRRERQQNIFEDSYPNKQPLEQISMATLIEFPIQISPVTFLGGGSMPTDLALLQGLCKQNKSCKYFEIGTWRGESAAIVAQHCESVTSMYLLDSKMQELGFKKSYILAHAKLCENIENIHLIRADSTKFDYKSLNKKFDVIFIDGNHHYDFVVQDSMNVFKHLLHDDSIVVWHDYAYSPEDIRYEVYRGILDGTPKEFHDKIYHVQNTMCAVYLPNFKGDSLAFEDIIQPKDLFNITIDLA